MATQTLAGFSLVAGPLVLAAIAMAYLFRGRRERGMDPLQRPEFWAGHYYELATTEHRETSEFIGAVFGISYDNMNVYCSSLVRQEGKVSLIAVPAVAGFDVGVEYVDCGDDGTETRYSIGHTDWTEREALGYYSAHFALPAFRWAEVELLAHAMELRSADEAARAMLLLFPAVYLTRDDNSDIVESALARAWKLANLPDKAIKLGMIHDAVAKQWWPDLTWSHDPELGWINNGPYSFRNPKTLMTSFEPRRFERVRSFLRAVERAAPE